MTNFLEIALSCIARGWYIFPCIPKSKKPLGRLVPHGKLDATNDEAAVRAWWADTPDANVGISCGPSNLCVLDMDEGPVQNADDLRAWLRDAGLPVTYTVRTGRRFKDNGEPEFGVHLYFSGALPDVGLWKHAGGSGQVKSLGGYVLAAGSIHPSGEAYAVLWDEPLARTPDVVRSLKTGERESLKVVDGKKIPDGAGRHHALTSVAGGLRAKGLDGEAIYDALVPINPAMCEVPISDEDLKAIAYGVARRYPAGEVEPQVVIGGRIVGAPEEAPEPVDWRTRYMTEAAYLNVKPPEFLIDGFLVKKSIAMLAGPVAQRKSIIALNIAHSLITGEPLFGYFDVPGGHERVVYLCPEMGAASFVRRVRQIGLGPYVGKTLFIQTMSEKPTALDELDGELPGAVVIVDTITRFIEGNENESGDMRKFAQKVFRLMNAGATVILLHHSKKGSSGSLDDGLRGSSELAAFVDSCWVTELEDPKKPYESLSKMRNVKQRDFESNPFKLQPAPGSFYLTITGEPEPEAALKSRAEEGAREALASILKKSPQMGVNKLRDALKAKGHGKGSRWITTTRVELLGAGALLSAGRPILHTHTP
jgi:hypothetical protein